MNEPKQQTTSSFELFIYALLAVIGGLVAFVAVLVALLGEWVILAIGAVVAIGITALVVWIVTAFVTWLWSWVGDKRQDWADRSQNRALQAATARHQFLLEDKRAQLAYPVDGFLPVAHDAIIGGDYNVHLLELSARRIDTLAPVANVPHSLTYSPHVSQKGELATLPEVANTFVAPATDFFGLFMGGKLPRDRFLVGTSLEDGSEVFATWQNLYSALIGGMSGSGKSTLIRSLLAQSALQGGRFVVVDPHYGAGEESLGASLEPLRNLMLCDVASNDREMLSALKFVADIGQRRLSGQDKDKSPIVLVVDETTGLLQRGNVADQLVNVLGMIAQETRKVGLYAFCIGQNFSSQVLPSEVRNSFVSFISMRARRDVARVQSGNNEFGKLAEQLTIGQCVWMTPSGEVHRLSVPNCTQSHLAHVAQTLTVKPNELPMTEPMTIPMTQGQNQGQGDTLIMGEVMGQVMSAEDQRIRQLFMGGASVGDIAVDIFGVSKTAGNPYITACNKVQAAIRKSLS